MAHSLQARYGKITHQTTRSAPPPPRPTAESFRQGSLKNNASGWWFWRSSLINIVISWYSLPKGKIACQNTLLLLGWTIFRDYVSFRIFLTFPTSPRWFTEVFLHPQGDLPDVECLGSVFFSKILSFWAPLKLGRKTLRFLLSGPSWTSPFFVVVVLNRLKQRSLCEYLWKMMFNKRTCVGCFLFHPIGVGWVKNWRPGLLMN